MLRKFKAYFLWKYHTIFKLYAFSDRPWLTQAENVCFGTRGHQYGEFNLKHTGQLQILKLVHESGGVTCYPTHGTTNFGCDGVSYYTSDKVAIVISDSENKRIIPKDVSSEFYQLEGYNAFSKELVFDDLEISVNRNQVLRIWYGEDFYTLLEGDNSGTSCVTVKARICIHWWKDCHTVHRPFVKYGIEFVNSATWYA